MTTPNWFLGWLGFSILIVTSQVFLCTGESGVPEETNNPFQYMLNLVTFQGCTGIGQTMSLILFSLVTLPALLIIYAVGVAPLLNNSVTGAITGIVALTGVLIGLVAYLF